MTIRWPTWSKFGQESARPSEKGTVADVCLIVEGAYPFVVGGVSSWLQDLIANLPELRFAVVAIKASGAPTPWKLQPPPNVVSVTEMSLAPELAKTKSGADPAFVGRVAALMLEFVAHGGTPVFEDLVKDMQACGNEWTAGELLAHPSMFNAIVAHFTATTAASSFHHFFWALRTLLGGLIAAVLTPLPRARMYHTISTGFAGLIAARAAIETGRPVAITEHGIYLLERQIEIMMADWIGDQVDAGLALDAPVRDLRHVWRDSFQHYTQTCYDCCDPIIALYAANSDVQRRLGAAEERLMVIPNGIDYARFDALEDRRDPAQPVVALIGRVVPIKDVKTFVRAAALAHAELPIARYVILGPTDEDEQYAAECMALATALGVTDVVTFEGRVRVDEWLPRIDLIVLTSLSEAQPLVILEAGACGIPSVAPDVGSCRELLEGRGSEHDDVGAGGIITALVDPEATAAAILTMLVAPPKRVAMGACLKRRVARHYTRETIIAQYRALYRKGERPDPPGVHAHPA